MKQESSNSEYYVYLYRNSKNKARYVGQGRKVERAASHVSGSHNSELAAFLKAGKYSLEIAGPFGSPETALAVETAVITALQPDLNRSEGQTKWRFRPLGVPLMFADRLDLKPLTRRDFRKESTSTLFVKINNKDFNDGRVGYDPANPPSNSDILERINKYWQLGPYLAEWRKKPALCPTVLVGVNGPPGAQVIIGAVKIDQKALMETSATGSFEIPTTGPKDLDAFGWRGRRIAVDADIRFGSFRSQFFLILEKSRVRGGHPTTN